MGVVAPIALLVALAASPACEAASAQVTRHAVTKSSAPKWRSSEILPATASGTIANLTPISVSCAARGYCAASANGGTGPVAAFDTRGRWTHFGLLPLPAGAAPNDSEITSVSCPVKGFCATVGYFSPSQEPINDQAFVDTETDGHWAEAVTVAPPAGHSGAATTLSSVSCVSRSYCVAAGTLSETEGNAPLTVVFSDGSWTAGASPAWPNITATYLAWPDTMAISCPGVGDCVAVAAAYKDGGTVVSLGWVQSKGRWKRAAVLQAPPHSPSGTGDFLDSLSCTTSRSCVATGYFLTPTGDHTLQLDLARGRWRPGIDVRGKNAPDGGFGAVSCTSYECVGVGSANVATDVAVTERHGTTLRGAIVIGLPSNGNPKRDEQETDPRWRVVRGKGLVRGRRLLPRRRQRRPV
jgi:hypothetical protein